MRRGTGSCTSREIANVLLHLWIPTFALNRKIPQRRRGRALGEDEGDANDTDDEEEGNHGDEKVFLCLVVSDDAEHQDDDANLANGGTHDVEGLRGPVELDGHDSLVLGEIVDMSTGAVIDFWRGDHNEGQSQQLRCGSVLVLVA